MLIYYVGVHRNECPAVLALGIDVCTLTSYEYFARRPFDEGIKIIMEDVKRRKEEERADAILQRE